MAESEGFEPPDLLQSTVFKTAAFDHSASSPVVKVILSSDIAVWATARLRVPLLQVGDYI